MRRIIRNVDTLDSPKENAIIQQSLYSQKDINSSSSSIASSEITNAIKSMSDRVVNSISDLGPKFSGLDKFLSESSDGSLFSALKDRKRFSDKEGSGIKTLSKSTESNENDSPLAVRNNISDDSFMGYMQTLSYLSVPPKRKTPAGIESPTDNKLNKISKSLDRLNETETVKNNTLGKIFRLLDDRFYSFLNNGGNNSLLPDIDINRSNRRLISRPNSRAPKKPRLSSRLSRSLNRIGLGGILGTAGAIAGGGILSYEAYNAAGQVSEHWQKNPEDRENTLSDFSRNLGYENDPTLSSLREDNEKGTRDIPKDVSPNVSPIIDNKSGIINEISKETNIPEIPRSTDDIKREEISSKVDQVREAKVLSPNANITTKESDKEIKTNLPPSTNSIASEYNKPLKIESESSEKELSRQTSLIREEVSVIRDIKRLLEDQKTNKIMEELNSAEPSMSNSSKESTQTLPITSNTSTGMSGSSMSIESPSGLPSGGNTPMMSGMSLPSAGGEPGVDIPNSASMGSSGANASVQGYLSVMQKNVSSSPSYSQPDRMGENSYDCSSFVSRSLAEAGFDISPSNTTTSLPSALSKIGFKFNPLPIPAKTTKAPEVLQAGDIMLNPGSHVETYAGDNRIIGAHSTASGVSLKNFYSTGYPGFWRLGGSANLTQGGETGASYSTPQSGYSSPMGGGSSSSGGFGSQRGGYSTSGIMSTSTVSTSGSGGVGELLSRGIPSSPMRPIPRGGYNPNRPYTASTSDLLSTQISSSSGGFGSLLSKYETGGRGTSQITNSRGDKGGASYGKFQLSHKTGSLKEFMSTLQRNDPQAYSQLAPLWSSAGSGGAGAFGQKWKELASQGRLQKSEDSYARKNYMQGAMSRLKDKALIQRINSNPALQEVFLSTSVQHGAGGSSSIWNKVANSNMSDEDIIKSVYAERGRVNPDGSLAHFSGNSASIQRGVARRFKNEVRDALSMNARVKSGNYPITTPMTPGINPQSSPSQINSEYNGTLNTYQQQIDPNIGRYSYPTGGYEDQSIPMSGGDTGGNMESINSGGGGSSIPSFINDITLMAIQTQLMYDQ